MSTYPEGSASAYPATAYRCPNLVSEHELIMFQTYAIAKAEQQAEAAIVMEYSQSRDPDRLLRQRIHEIVACTASSVIDVQRPAGDDSPGGDLQWHRENISRTEKRLASDPIFSRLVSAQANMICREVEMYQRGTHGK